MRDCVLDTHILVQIIACYNPKQPSVLYLENTTLSPKQTKAITEIISLDGNGAIISASTMAFIEIFNQFSIISKSEQLFTREKLFSFIQQPPSWFNTEDLTITTSELLTQVPKFDRRGNRIELADAIHVATAMQRGPKSLLATNDGRLNSLDVSMLDIEII